MAPRLASLLSAFGLALLAASCAGPSAMLTGAARAHHAKVRAMAKVRPAKKK